MPSISSRSLEQFTPYIKIYIVDQLVRYVRVCLFVILGSMARTSGSSNSCKNWPHWERSERERVRAHVLRQTAIHNRVWVSKNGVGPRGLTTLQGVAEGMPTWNERPKSVLVQVPNGVPVWERTGGQLTAEWKAFSGVPGVQMVDRGTLLMTQLWGEREFRGRNPCRK